MMCSRFIKGFNYLLLILYLLPWEQNLKAQDFTVCTFSEELASRDTIYKVDFRDGSKEVIYILGVGQYIMDSYIKISPRREMVGLNLTMGPWLQDERGAYYMDRKLVIIDTTGRTLFELVDVQRYAWSPDGRALACITGRDYEGFGFWAEKLIVVNTSNWNQQVLQEGIAYQDIVWAEFDSMIYTTDFQYVYRANPRTGKVEKTGYKGIYFSPDGRYYFVANYEGGTFAVYERRTNKNVTPKGFEGNPAVNFHRWLPKGSTLVFGDIFREKQVYDVATRTVKKRISGQLLGYNTQIKEFIVLKHHRDFPEVPDKKIEKIADR